MPDITKIGDGEAGGKGKGLIKLHSSMEALKNLNGAETYLISVSFPVTVLITTSIFKEFISSNGLEGAIKEVERPDGGNFEALKEKFLAGKFTKEYEEQICSILDGMQKPLAVRSSSLLEDQQGASFAGKYESHFCSNQGTIESRRSEFLSAIKSVYASTYNPSAIAYREKHGFLNTREEMACVVQEVVGRRFRDYYLPALSGVGFSQNGYCWNKDINKHDGLVRLVMGLGTRAVGRGYVRLFSPVKPGMRPEGTEVNNVQKCSQKKVDVIDLKENRLTEVHFRELVSNGFDCYPGSQAFVSLRDGNYLYRPVSNLWDASHIPVLTMDGVLSGTWMGSDLAKTMGWLLKGLEKTLGFPVDMEFAVDADPEARNFTVYLLQARPLSEGEDKKPQPIPKLRNDDIVISVNRNLPTAYVPDIEYMVYVDGDAYHAWPHNEKQSVARVIGKLGEALKNRKFILIGPGRWGSWNPELGIPVTYAEISGCSALVEVARRRATYVPEVSFGSHFFQDLIEDNIAYLPVYPDEPGEIFNEGIFAKTSKFKELLPDDYYRKFDGLIKVVNVPLAADNRRAHAILNGELEKAVVFLK